MRQIIKYSILLILLIVLISIGRSKLAAFHYNQGMSYYDGGLYEKAIISFKNSLKIKPSVEIAHYMLGNSYIEKKLENDAIGSYKKAIQINPYFIQAYCALGDIYRTKHMYQEALVQLEQAEIMVPDNQKIEELLNSIFFEYVADCLNKGIDSFLAENKPEGYALLNEALRAKPDFFLAHYTLAYFYFIDCNYDEAVENLNRAIEVNSQFWPAYRLLGNIYFEKGLYEEAIAEYQTALALDSGDIFISNDLGLALVQIEDYDGALLHLKKASKLDPNNLNIRYNLASTYRDNRMFHEAAAEYKKIISYQPDYPNIHNDLGDIYKEQKKNKRALEEYSKETVYCRYRLLANPEDMVVLNNLAYALNAMGEYGDAKETVEKSLALQPGYRDAYLTLAKICENLGDTEGALSALNKASTLSGQANFIVRDIARLKKELNLWNNAKLLADTAYLYTVYLKNGRCIRGSLKEEDDKKVVLEVNLGLVKGYLTFYRNAIAKVVAPEDKTR